MSKETMLKKAFDVAMVNGAVSGVDENAANSVIKNMMLDYAKSNKVDITEKEIADYVSSQKDIINKATSDFKIQTKMMK